MKATISLKQLRNDPLEFVRLLNSGYEVDITEHRRTIAKAIQPFDETKKPEKGDINEVLRVIDSLAKIQTPFPKENTVKLIDKARHDYLGRKYG